MVDICGNHVVKSNKGWPEFSLKLPSIRDILLRGVQRGNAGQGRASCPGGPYRAYKLGIIGIGSGVKETDRRNR